MRVFAVANQKGGCGKTTVSINLAACFARDGQRTLLIDLDPQGHCALGLSVPEEQIQHHTGDVLLGRSGVTLERVVWQISSNFDLAPSKLDLGEVEGKLASADDRLTRLRDAMRVVQSKYDVVVIDTPPTVGVLTSNALLASTDVVVPVDTGYFALHGLSKQLETMERIYKRTGHRPALRILGNLYDVRTKLAREILAELRRRHRDSMTSTFINFNTKLKEGTSFGQPITEYDPASSGCRDFMRLARELLASKAATESTPAVQAPTVMQRAEDLAIKANALLATAKPLFGPNSARIDEQLAESEAAAGSPGAEHQTSAWPGEPAVTAVASVAETVVAREADRSGASSWIDAGASDRRTEFAGEAARMAEALAAASQSPVSADVVATAHDAQPSRPLAGVWRPEPVRGESQPADRLPPDRSMIEARVSDRPASDRSSLERTPGEGMSGLRALESRIPAGSAILDAFIPTRGAAAESRALPFGTTTTTSANATAPRTEIDHDAIQRRIDHVYGVHPVPHGVRFVINAPSATSVRLAGDFNGWAPNTTPLQSNGSADVFAVTLPLGPGRYQYRYVIDGQWRNDPHNAIVERNPFGELNNVVEVA